MTRQFVEELIDFVAQTTARIGSDDPRLKATAVIAALDAVKDANS